MVAELLVPNPPPLRSSLISQAMEADRGTKSVEGKNKGKGGKSERMEPYEGLENVASGVKRNAESPGKGKVDPMLKSILKTESPARASKRQHATGPAVHDIASPPSQGTQLQMAPPGIPQIPEGDCNLEQLRHFTVTRFEEMAREIQNSENRILQRLHANEQTTLTVQGKVNILEPLGHHIKDLDVFAKVKNFVTTDVVEAQAAMAAAETQVIKGVVETQATKAAAETQVIRDKLDGFVNTLEGYLATMQGLETSFQQHVDGNFKAVENECQQIRTIIKGVNDAAGGAHGATTAAMQIQFGQLREQVQNIEMQGNVSQATQQEMALMQEQIGQIIQRMAQLKEGEDRQAACSSNQGRYPCHCKHLDEWVANLDQRVIAMEQGRAGAAPQHPPQVPPQHHAAWAGYRPVSHGAHGGDEGDQGPNAAHRVNQAFPDLAGLNLQKLFDDKVALSAAYQYDGCNAGEHWRRKVRGYWIAKCPDLMPLLDWSEGMDEAEITPEILTQEANSHRWMTEINVKRMGEILWGFLNLCLTEKAHTVFEGADMLNGFEGWRLVVQHIHQGQKVRKATIRRLVRNPPAIHKLEDVAMGIARFENLMKDYKAAGGKVPDDGDLKEDLVNSLPQEIRENLLWRASGEETFAAFKNHIRTTANSMLYHRGKMTPLNSFQEEDHVNEGEDWEYNEAIAAVHKKFGKGGGGGGGYRYEPRTFTKGKSKGDKGDGKGTLRCGNCGAEHSTRNCTKPRLPNEQRLCFGCGEPGHMSRNCPKKGKGPLKNVDEGDTAHQVDYGHVQFGCVDNSKNFIAAKKTFKPTPKGYRVADFIDVNSFAALSGPGEPRPSQTQRKQGAMGTRPLTRVRETPTAEVPPPPAPVGVRQRRARGQNLQDNRPLTRVNLGVLDAPVPSRGAIGVPADKVATEARTRATSSNGMASNIGLDADILTIGDIKRMASYQKNELNTLKTNSDNDEDRVVAPLEWREDPEPIMAANEKVKIYVAADSGAVDHCSNPKDLPDSVPVKPPERPRGFVGAKGDDIDHYGSAQVALELEDGRYIDNTFQVADVCRPLHAVSKITDNAGDMLFKKGCAYVVPEGVFDKVLATVTHLATYPRKGGLYVAEMYAVDPKSVKSSSPPKSQGAVDSTNAINGERGGRRWSGFARQDAAR